MSRVPTPGFDEAFVRVLRLRAHVLAHARGCLAGAFESSFGIGNAREERVRIDNHDTAGQVRIFGGKIERQEPAEAMADDDRVIEFVFADVGGEAVAHAIEHRSRYAWHARESGDGEHMAFEAVFITCDGGVPNFA